MLGSTARCFIRGRLNFADSCATISLLLPAPARTRQPLASHRRDEHCGLSHVLEVAGLGARRQEYQRGFGRN